MSEYIGNYFQEIKEKGEKLSKIREGISCVLKDIEMLEDEELNELQTKILKELDRRDGVRKKQFKSFKELMNQEIVWESRFRYYINDVDTCGKRYVSDMTKDLATKVEENFDKEGRVYEYNGLFYRIARDVVYSKGKPSVTGKHEEEKVYIELIVSKVDVQKLSDEI